MKHIFEQAIANVQSAYPSIYTKEDVVRLIQGIQTRVDAAQEESAKPAARDFLEAVKESMLEGIKNISIEDFVELELNYGNQIDINIDTRALLNGFEDCFDIAVTEVLPETKN